MDRREFLQAAGAGVLSLSVSGRVRAVEGRKPNILFIMTDQQFADALSCAMGDRYIKTPNIDSIAANGMRFTRAYCANPLCVPSRSSMFTGRYPHEHGRQTNQTKPSLDPMEFPNMGMVLRQAGYVTGYCGKWHLPFPGKGKPADQSGFDFTSHLGGGGNDPQIAAPSIEFLRQNRDKPFLLVCSFMNPHNICQYGRSERLPDGDVGKPSSLEQCPSAPANLEKAQHQSDIMETLWQSRLRAVRGRDKKKMFAPLDTWKADDWRRYRWAYYRMVELVDREVGKILAALREKGLEKNTVIIFTSDHGDGIGAHRWAQKNMFYDEVARIPLLVSQKGKTKTGTTDSLANNGIDLLPTVCDYAGAELPTKCRGISLRPLAEGKSSKHQRNYVVSSTHFVQDKLANGDSINLQGRMVRTDRYKYYIFDQGKQPEMLIDMQNDPGEMVNQATNPAFREILVRHRAYLREYAAETGDRLALTL
jgi:arylsulfatase A-like enzyme